MQRYGNFFKLPNYSLLYYIFFCGVVCFLDYILENVLSSEAGCPIIVIIRRTRFAQTASHVDLLSLLCNSRIEEDSDNSTSSKDLLVRSVFREHIRENMEHRAVTSLLASLVEVIGLLLPPLSSRLSDGAVRGKLSLLKLSRVATEFDVVK